MCITIASISIAILIFLIQRRLDIEKEQIKITSGIFQNPRFLNFPIIEVLLLHLRHASSVIPQFVDNLKRRERLSSIIHSTLIATSFALFVVVVSIFNTWESLKVFNTALFLSLIALFGSLIGGLMIWMREETRFNGN